MAESLGQTLLLVEDDLELAELTKEFLEGEGFRVIHELDGKAGRDRILAESPDLVVLDIMLPGLNGYTVCQEVRPTYAGPILFLTARDEELDEILGLEMGGDDYMTKPVQPQLLLARIRALLRRASVGHQQTDANRVVLGDLTVDARRREVHLADQQIELTTFEFDLLWYLCGRVGEVVSRQDIYQALFHYDYDGLDRSVDVYISRIRQKLGGDDASFSIKTVRGVGYLLAATHS
ncbi:MAG: response regulator transcription factor [bacterium]|nr:response regulator transcription factor [bacterium]